MITARKYNKDIELFTQTSARDEYNHMALSIPVSIGVFPAQVRELSDSRKMILFQSVSLKSYEMTLRYLDIKPSKVIYRGAILNVFSAEDSPNNTETRLIVSGVSNG